jgi:hypothetical protein
MSDAESDSVNVVNSHSSAVDVGARDRVRLSIDSTDGSGSQPTTRDLHRMAHLPAADMDMMKQSCVNEFPVHGWRSQQIIWVSTLG